MGRPGKHRKRAEVVMMTAIAATLFSMQLSTLFLWNRTTAPEYFSGDWYAHKLNYKCPWDMRHDIPKYWTRWRKLLRINVCSNSSWWYTADKNISWFITVCSPRTRRTDLASVPESYNSPVSKWTCISWALDSASGGPGLLPVLSALADFSLCVLGLDRDLSSGAGPFC